MNGLLVKSLIAVAVVVATAGMALGVQIDFTGGTAYLTSGGTGTTTSGYDYYSNTDYYIENGFMLDFVNPPGAWGEYIGDYYGQDATGNYNDVIHGHWQSGFGDMTAIQITKVGGGTFDLNYFILTSNTQIGGGSATGNELAYIEAWVGGAMTYSQLLPPDSWGWNGVQNPGPLQNDPQIYLGSQFDAVDMVQFTVGNAVDCFGMDEFFIDEAPPPQVPEPSAFLTWGGLVGLGLVGGWWRKRRSK